MNKDLARIYLRLSGGLGNQLFQFAFAKALIAKGHEVVLDVSRFSEDPKRNYELHKYHHSLELNEDRKVTNHFINNAKKIFEQDLRGINFLARKLRPTPPALYYIQKNFTYTPIDRILTAPLYLDGTWQSPKYFKDIVDISKLNLKVDLNGKNAEVRDKIRNSKLPVAVHIRRADYVSEKKTAKLHGNLAKDYYETALQILADKYSVSVADFDLFIFSDDPDWVKSELELSKKQFALDLNSISEGEKDIELMRNCKGYVIANSTFSWWGAWLSYTQDSDKYVVAPKTWLAVDENSSSDIVPAQKNWIRV